MCDELTAAIVAAFVSGCTQDEGATSTQNTVNSTKSETSAIRVSEHSVSITMPDGVSDSYFVHPSEGTHPAILMWPDIKGLRPAFKAMGMRLAQAGYSVLVVNPFYRDAKAPVVGPNANFRDPETRNILIPMARKLTQETSMADARAYIQYLDNQPSVDTKRKIGTAGYCMGGPLIMRTAAAVPDRVGAAASFHGGGLVRDSDDSPHLLIPQSPAHVLHAIAQNDDERSPTVKTDLAAAYEKAGTAVYNEAQAEKAWARMLALFEKTLT